MSDLRNSQMHQQMLALARIQKRRRVRYWLNAIHLSAILFLADQILKVWCLRQLAPGDQVQFWGQGTFVLTHLATGGSPAFLLSALEWGLWVLVAVVLVMRSADAGASEIYSSMVLLVAGLSNAATRSVLGSGLNVFAIQGSDSVPWVSFNLAHAAIAVTSFLLTTAWLKALWPESLARRGSVGV
jgi:lipoprotein signal peptidase